jgi:hypothetical protein
MMAVPVEVLMRLCVAVCLAGLCTLASAAMAQAPAGGEQLFLIPPPGWSVGFHSQQGNVELTEIVPQGQSVQDWTEMLTVQLITGKPEKSPQEVLKDQVDELQKACDDVGAGATAPQVENGYDTAIRAILCTKSKQWGKGELTLYKVIRGRERLYVIARAWRGAPFDKDHLPVPPEKTQEWLQFMQRVSVCDARDGQRPCPGQRATPGPQLQR